MANGTSERPGREPQSVWDRAPGWAWWASFVFPGALALFLVIASAAGIPISVPAALGVVGLIVVWAMVLLCFFVRQAVASRRDTDVVDRLDAMSASIDRMSEQFTLSDDARRVLHRDRERELLRRAISEDIEREDWDAAMVLVHELAERFGYRADAEEFRGRIEEARSETVERKVVDAIAHIDGLIIQRRWDAAISDARRLQRLYPDSARTEGVRQRVESARAQYRAELERRLLEATQQGDIDDAMELLRELDGYLSEAEAEPFREVAKGVIGRARENLGAQFKLAVHHRRWDEAVVVGDRIVREFPNTRMAAEVRQVIDGIRTKAAGLAG